MSVQIFRKDLRRAIVALWQRLLQCLVQPGLPLPLLVLFQGQWEGTYHPPLELYLLLQGQHLYQSRNIIRVGLTVV
jgi:hypothetical protein